MKRFPKVKWSAAIVGACLVWFACFFASMMAMGGSFQTYVVHTACFVASIGVVLFLLVYFVPRIAYRVYESRWFASDDFADIKSKLASYVDDCNELNAHILDLEDTPVPGGNQMGYGSAELRDSSIWNYRRPELGKDRESVFIHSCSRAVCSNVQHDPIRYVCKYFHIDATLENIDAFGELANNYSAAVDGKEDLKAKYQEIVDSAQIPNAIAKYGMERFDREIGFSNVDLQPIDFPTFQFVYVSSGGYSSLTCDVVMDLENIDAMLHYLDSSLKSKKSVAGQRALMTPKLRQQILERDGYTCKKCGANLHDEPHLLLEVDHIIPVSKGGLTTWDNLQTLCWKCNRSKGAKIE